ncbi:sulfur reduction protein DsrE [Marinobacter lipolyticus]|uniref:DsrE family protein n=1 Tax=Marinobacter lipolyticus TaxID=209639 RepID=UPI001BCD9DBD|nr:DsrE family protein [Marinobacter lipolyticus]MBS8239085.1 sulfur reduction protein DsrE [Marinobacter lipolyticus]
MHTLIVIDCPPYGSWSGRESLDMAFSLAAFDQPVSLLFIGEGVLWLKQGQQADAVAQKSVERNLKAAAIFGIDALLVDNAACRRFGLNEGALIDGTLPVDDLRATMDRFDHVVLPG